MGVIGEYLTRGLRIAKAPLAAGALITLATWIQLSDILSNPWPGEPFAAQLAALTDNLAGIGTASLLLLVIGVVGSVSIKIFSMLLEPTVRWWLDRWNDRVEVRKDVQRKRENPLFEHAANVQELAQESVRRESRHLTNAWHSVLDWFPSRKSREDYLTENFWLTPKWTEQILPWVIHNINETVDDDPRGHAVYRQPIEHFQNRLSKNNDLSHLMLALERAVERDPAACIASAQEKEIVLEINSLIGENDFRIAISPPLAVLGLSIGIAWWSWAFVVVPLAIAVYCSALNQRKDIAVLCLDRLLNGMGSCNALDQLKVWARREAYRLIDANDPA